jgi:hypothetical protein
MAERNVNLLLSEAAQPSNGLANTNVLQWFGGRFKAIASGTFAGATAKIMVSAKAPKDGNRQDYIDNPGDYDWIELTSFVAPGTFELENLNPCGLAIEISGSAGTTRVRVIVSPDA